MKKFLLLKLKHSTDFGKGDKLTSLINFISVYKYIKKKIYCYQTKRCITIRNIWISMSSVGL